jgi:hypothetical protein
MKVIFHTACDAGLRLTPPITARAPTFRQADTRLALAYQRAASRLHWLTLGSMLMLSLGLAACGPAPRTHQSLSAAIPALAPPPAPKTLESTLRLDPGVEEMPFYPQIAESAHGDSVAVWEQFDGEHYNIWGNSRRAHQGWGRAHLIQTSDTGHSYNPRVAINPLGQAAAVWVQVASATGSYAIWSSRLEPGADWSRPVRVETGKAGPSYAPDVAIDERGNAVAVWQQSDGRQVHVRANRFVAGVGWGQASRLERGNGDLGAPHVAVDAGGNAMVVWPRFQLSRSDLWASRYGPGGVWARAMRIDAVPGYVPSPQVMASAAGSPGEFTVLWEQQQGFQTGVGASHYQPGRGWRPAGHECAGQLQAMGAAGTKPAGSAAHAPAAPGFTAGNADLCY